MGDDTAKDGPVEPDNRRLLLSYLAGFFDGEGCIYARKRGNRAEVVLEASQVMAEPLGLFVRVFGGKVDTPRAPGRLVFRWRIHKRSAVRETLRELYPDLRVKREQARLALELLFFLDSSRRRSPPSSRDIERIHYLVDQISALKRM